jgi:hypothetical protein
MSTYVKRNNWTPKDRGIGLLRLTAAIERKQNMTDTDKERYDEIERKKEIKALIKIKKKIERMDCYHSSFNTVHFHNVYDKVLKSIEDLCINNQATSRK